MFGSFIKDSLSKVGSTIGKGVSKASSAFKSATDWVGDKVSKGASAIQKGLSKVVDPAISIGKWASAAAVPVGAALTATGVGATIGPAISAAGAAGYSALDKVQDLREDLGRGVDKVAKAASGENIRSTVNKKAGKKFDKYSRKLKKKVGKFGK